ncbi:hypothetical protein E4S40_05525 [Algoriphagus kandeliae]|uniref:Uncharacterized protein n=1 Tax=Algoriphagus kandeliae TaxID=2562278 RepID=A0A4Y9QVZ5_9BACT|nr:hypothetical protein [Algoriphagus kandeliae]TFV95682.1 hypothetical protein E4S40_05525 [Algoriphagus kandeliae]
MQKYKNLHKWMIIPMLFMQFGIFRDYWGDFSENAWSVHVHYWTGTIWYLYLIIQPYYATHGQLEKHRTNGIIGMFLAGGVCITAFSMMYRDIATTQRATEMPDLFGPFEPWFFFGVAAVEIPMIIAFGYAVIKSILQRKNLEDHAWWLISTVFIIMMPALARGIQNVYVGMNIDDWPNIDIMGPVYFAQALIIGLTLVTAWKYKKLKHPGTYLAVGINIYTCFLEPLGRSETVQHLLKTLIKG